jgi:hypothetical protein
MLGCIVPVLFAASLKEIIKIGIKIGDVTRVSS